MGLRGGFKWPSDQEVYNESQVAAVLEDIGVEIKGETENVFLCLCPFHNNTYSPAFCVSKEKGLYYCQNGACSKKGNLRQLIAAVKGEADAFAVNRLINKHAQEIDYAEEMRKRMEEFSFVAYTDHDLTALRSAFPSSPAHAYMAGRGFSDDTLRHFDVGYSVDDPRAMAVVPVHDPNGMAIGFVGRSIVEKRFQNSDDLPKSKTLFNYHNARRTGGTGILVEAAFDAMMVHQAGYPNVMATLGGSLSNHQIDLLGRTFDTIIIMTDWDFTGRKLGRKVEATFPHKSLKWAGIGGLYPKNEDGKMFKDATAMGTDNISACLRDAISNFEYHQMVLEDEEALFKTVE